MKDDKINQFHNCMENFRDNLSLLRTKLKNFTLTEMAQDSGIARDTLHKLEKGRIPHPTIKTIWAVCEYLGISMDDMFNVSIRDIIAVENFNSKRKRNFNSKRKRKGKYKPPAPPALKLSEVQSLIRKYHSKTPMHIPRKEFEIDIKDDYKSLEEPVNV